ncbi:MAG: hypothetical protein SFX72_20225 [Isosphaeraceae bacterium]|nr:hypothetical protein [Isosphaeraceae bacterium]
MNPQDMLDYALGRLDGPALTRATREIETDPLLRTRCDRLQGRLHLLLDDGLQPSGDLRTRTLAFVASHAKAAPPIEASPRILDFVPRTVPFRFSDIAVAAGIFLAGVLTLLPALHRGRMEMNQTGCLTNLREIGRALAQYADAKGSYPKVQPGEYPLAALVELHQGGFLPDLHRVECPCNGPCESESLVSSHLDEILRPAQAPDVLDVRCDYAFHIGFLRNGAPVPLAPNAAGTIPLVADQPRFTSACEIASGNSPNHGGRGQNVLYSDQSVRWHRSRSLVPSDRDLFLNERLRPSYGIHEGDISLIPGVIKVQRY